MENPPQGAADPWLLREALVRQAYSKSVITGRIALPAVPALVDEFVRLCGDLFTAAGVRFTVDELAHLKLVLEAQLAAAYLSPQRSQIVISYDAPVGRTLSYQVEVEPLPGDEHPSSGAEPDARVLALAGLGGQHVLDVGAGTGRNALALARCGNVVDAVEVNSILADGIRQAARQGALQVRVIEGNVFAGNVELRRDYQLVVFCGVVRKFRTTEELRAMFELAARCLTPGGCLVFDAVVPRADYMPDGAAREFGQQVSSTIFTRRELGDAAALLALDLVADDPVAEDHGDAGRVRGQDVFDLPPETSPVEARWLVYQSRGRSRPVISDIPGEVLAQIRLLE